MARTPRRIAPQFDIARLVGRGLSLPCAMTLDALLRAGVPMREHGPWLIVSIDGLTGELLQNAMWAAEHCKMVAVIRGSARELRALDRVIRAAVAATLFEEAWEMRESYAHEDDRSHKRRPLPKTVPAGAKKAASELIARFEDANQLPVAVMYQVAAQMPHGPRDRKPTPDGFGHYTAMEAMGHGVSWEDYHPAHGFEVPYYESYYL